MIPEDFVLIHGDYRKLFRDGIPKEFKHLIETQIQPAFKTQSITNDTWCYVGSSCHDLSFAMSLRWPTPLVGPSGSSFVHGSGEYGFSLKVKSTGTNPAGIPIATMIELFVMGKVNQSGKPFFDRSLTAGPIRMVSQDGLNFSFGSMGSSYYRSLLFQYGSGNFGTCEYKSSWGNSSNQYPGSARLTLYPAGKNAAYPDRAMATFYVSTSGSMTGGGSKGKDGDPDCPYQSVGFSGGASSSTSAAVPITFKPGPVPDVSYPPEPTPSPGDYGTCLNGDCPGGPYPSSTPGATASPSAGPTPTPSSSQSPCPVGVICEPEPPDSPTPCPVGQNCPSSSPEPTPCPEGQVCATPDPNGNPGSSASPSSNPNGGPSDNPNSGPSDNPSTGPSTDPSDDPSASPTPNGAGECPDGYVVDGQSCVYCPSEYFGYTPAEGCFIHAKLGIEHHSPASGAPIDPPVFSPRDLNTYLDQLAFSLQEQGTTALPFATWQMRIIPKTGPLTSTSPGQTPFDGGDKLKFDDEGNPLQGDHTLVYDGWDEKQRCLIDGQYLLTADSEPFVFVPGYGLPVPSYLKLSAASSDHPLVKLPGATATEPARALEFWVDNTPPIINSITSTEVKHDGQIFTEINMIIADTLSDSTAGISLASLSPKIYLEKTAIEVQAESLRLSNAGSFWIADADDVPIGVRELIPLSIEQIDTDQIKIRFEFNGRLGAKYLNFLLSDKVGNQGAYIVTKQNLR